MNVITYLFRLCDVVYANQTNRQSVCVSLRCRVRAKIKINNFFQLCYDMNNEKSSSLGQRSQQNENKKLIDSACRTDVSRLTAR